MRYLLLLPLMAGALCAQTELRAIPEVLKNPGQLRMPRDWQKQVVRNGMTSVSAAPLVVAARPEQGCSIRLLEVPIPEGSKITVIRPEIESRMPLLSGPLPACEAANR